MEHADYAGRSYGTLRSELEQRVRAGVPVVLEIEVQGARQVRAAMPEAVQVFIAPPSLAALRTRLVGRGTDDAAEVERRLRVAEEELAAQPEFGHVVVNDRLDDALERLAEIVAARARLTRAGGAAGSAGRGVYTRSLNKERQRTCDLPPHRPPARAGRLKLRRRDRRRQARAADQQLLPQPR